MHLTASLHARSRRLSSGTDGIALRLRKTTIYQDGKRLRGHAAITALDGADTASLSQFDSGRHGHDRAALSRDSAPALSRVPAGRSLLPCLMWRAPVAD